MSRCNMGEDIWRIHDHITDSGGGVWLIFRNACEANDYWVRREVFAGGSAALGVEGKQP